MTTQQDRKHPKTKNKNTPVRSLLVAREAQTGAVAKIILEQLFYTLVRSLKNRPIDLPDFGNIMKIYDNPALADTEEFRQPKMKAVLIKGATVDVLLSLGSVRKLNARGQNAFNQTLIQVLDAGGYESVVTTTLSKICRDRFAASDLEKALSRNRTTLLAADLEIRVWEQQGNFMWMMLIWFATFEAEAFRNNPSTNTAQPTDEKEPQL